MFMLYISIRMLIKIKKNRTYSEAIKKWGSLNEIGGLFGLLILFFGYYNATKCGLEFELKK